MAATVLHVADLANLFSTTPKAITRRMERERDGGDATLPPHFRMGRRVAWRADVVDAWLAAKDPAGAKLMKRVQR
jgi:predicted DNA-binding transcriptional regulator AlpA